MKASELMINDWVVMIDTPYRNEISQVRANDFLNGCIQFNPIPLTAEILEKNGFIHTKMLVPGTMYAESLFELKGDGGVTRFLMHELIWHGIILSKVHELQHALRLCGLNDLADNFKI